MGQTKKGKKGYKKYKKFLEVRSPSNLNGKI
jgi:hypothetical protein